MQHPQHFRTSSICDCIMALESAHSATNTGTHKPSNHVWISVRTSDVISQQPAPTAAVGRLELTLPLNRDIIRQIHGRVGHHRVHAGLLHHLNRHGHNLKTCHYHSKLSGLVVSFHKNLSLLLSLSSIAFNVDDFENRPSAIAGPELLQDGNQRKQPASKGRPEIPRGSEKARSALQFIHPM